MPEQGGLPHPPETIPSHLQLGALSEELLQKTVDMEVRAELEGRLLKVSVAVTNTEAGPTDHPGRHLILTVEAYDPSGSVLQLAEGEQVPSWGGAQAGLPGKAYAKILQDVETGEYPVVSYWKQSLIRKDNRIPALARDESIYTFELPVTSDEITLQTTLRFR